MIRVLPLVAAGGLVAFVALIAVAGMRIEADSANPAQEIRDSVALVPIPQIVSGLPGQAEPSTTVAVPSPVVPVLPRSPAGAAAGLPDDGAAREVPAAQQLAPAAPLRPIEPTMVAVPKVDAGALERVEARPPLSELAQALPPKKPAPKPVLHRPVAEAAGVLVAGGRRITIAGIDPVDDGETCQRPGGGEWPCGRAARTAFRGFLRARSVTCDFPEGDVPDDLTTTCRMGSQDLGAWLAEAGWARASGEAYARQSEAARAAGRGIFGAGPAELPPAPTAPTGVSEPAATAPAAAGDGAADISILPEDPAAGSDTPLAEPVDPTGTFPAAPAAPADNAIDRTLLPPPSRP